MCIRIDTYIYIYIRGLIDGTCVCYQTHREVLMVGMTRVQYPMLFHSPKGSHGKAVDSHA